MNISARAGTEEVARIVGGGCALSGGNFLPDADILIATNDREALRERNAIACTTAKEALAILADAQQARLIWSFSGLTLGRDQLALALSDWTESRAPVHDLIAFDLAADPMRTRGLAWFCGQEVEIHPPAGVDRRRCAHLLADLAHDMLVGGPYRETVRASAPDLPTGEVLLRVTPGLVEIVVHAE